MAQNGDNSTSSTTEIGDNGETASTTDAGGSDQSTTVDEAGESVVTDDVTEMTENVYLEPQDDNVENNNQSGETTEAVPPEALEAPASANTENTAPAPDTGPEPNVVEADTEEVTNEET
jgi:hypothetical protein